MLVSLALVCAVGIIGSPALAQGRTTIQDATPGVMLAQATPEFAELIGRWVRTDGGYTIVIKSVDPNGKIDATYANPNPINISRAEASVEGSSLRIFIELRGSRLSRVHLHAHTCPDRGSPHGRILPGGHTAEIRRDFSQGQIARRAASGPTRDFRGDTDFPPLFGAKRTLSGSRVHRPCSV